MAFFFDTAIEQMFCEVGVTLEWWPGQARPELVPILGRPSLFLLSALPSTPRYERQIGDLAMQELLTRTDYDGLVDFFRALYHLDGYCEVTGVPHFCTSLVEQLVYRIGGEVADMRGQHRPCAVPREGRAPIFLIDTGRSAAGRARQLRELLFGELVAHFTRDSIVQLYKDLYAWQAAGVRRE